MMPSHPGNRWRFLGTCNNLGGAPLCIYNIPACQVDGYLPDQLFSTLRPLSDETKPPGELRFMMEAG